MKIEKIYRLEDLVAGLSGIVEIIGGSPSMQITAVEPLNTAHHGCLTWIRGDKEHQYALAEKTQASVIVCEYGTVSFSLLASKLKCFVLAKDAKLTIVQILSKLVSMKASISETAFISPLAKLGENISIGHGTTIGKATLGKNVTISSNVVIHDNVFIDDNVVIHSNVVIGGFGFNYATDSAGVHHPFPHVGGVQIGADCEIGSHTFISSGVLGPTKIGTGTKIAQFVYIGANTFIASYTQIRCRSSIMGSVRVGEKVTIAPSVTLRDEITVGDQAVIGMGSVVMKNIPAYEIWYGVPAIKRGSI